MIMVYVGWIVTAIIMYVYNVFKPSAIQMLENNTKCYKYSIIFMK